MPSRWIWFDFENTPHVLFLEPFIRRLEREGHTVLLTAKPQAQTLELAAQRRLGVTVIGSGELVARWRKVAGGLRRSTALAMWASRRGRPALLVSSSRTASLAAWVLGVKAISLMDYEHAEHRTIVWASESIWLPDVLREVTLPKRTRDIAHFYPGLKENLYLDELDVSPARERASFGMGAGDFVVVARPPASQAHYADSESTRLWFGAVTGLLTRDKVRLIVSPRNVAQQIEVARRLGRHDRLLVLKTAVSGPSLVGAADLVVGGGGTMNREAAVLGVPVWSVFTGPTPHIDDQLAAEGRLRWVRTEGDVRAALSDPVPARLERRGPFPDGFRSILEHIHVALRSRGGSA